MLKHFFALSAAMTLALSSCTSGAKEHAANPESTPKAIVCYFSATGTTEGAAKRIAALADADLYQIRPATPYTAADLDWRDSLSRSYVEMHNREIRPTIADTFPDMAQYDIVYIGYPNWWNTAPTIINTFIESYDFGGKTLVPFMTSGGSHITNSEKELGDAYPGLKWEKGLLMNSVSDADITEWIEAVKKASN